MPWVALSTESGALPQRVLVAGPSGSGKSTLAQRIALATGGRYVDLDSLAIGEDWTARASFIHDVLKLSAEPRWVTEWGYVKARPILANRADLMVLLDLPRHVVMPRLIRRTIDQHRQQTVLWNGNLQPPVWRAFLDHDHVIRWAWRTFHEPARDVERLLEQRPELPVVRLKSSLQLEDWMRGPLQRVTAASPTSPAPGNNDGPSR